MQLALSPANLICPADRLNVLDCCACSVLECSTQRLTVTVA
jgi:hypothetical protein